METDVSPPNKETAPVESVPEKVAPPADDKPPVDYAGAAKLPPKSALKTPSVTPNQFTLPTATSTVSSLTHTFSLTHREWTMPQTLSSQCLDHSSGRLSHPAFLSQDLSRIHITTDISRAPYLYGEPITLKHLQLDGDGSWLYRGLLQGSLVLVSDGSYNVAPPPLLDA